MLFKTLTVAIFILTVWLSFENSKLNSMNVAMKNNLAVIQTQLVSLNQQAFATQKLLQKQIDQQLEILEEGGKQDVKKNWKK